MSESSILIAKTGGVARLTINRPQVLNAMDSVAHLALSEALDEVAADHSVRVVVLTGAGERAFSVGRDLKEMAALERGLPEARKAAEDRWSRTYRLTDRHDYPKPIVACVQGLALGGGFELALACDLIIASETARFGLPEPRRGLIPFAGGVHRLPRQIPQKAAMGYLLTGRSIPAPRALELGLINQICPAEHLDGVVASWTDDILACSPQAIRAIRQCVREGLGRPLSDAMAAVYPEEERRKAGPDAIEGPRAFADRRAPVWHDI